MITENLSTLKIHKLTQAQYDRELAAGNIDENALYLTPEEEIDLSSYATQDYVDSAIANVNISDKLNDYYTKSETYSQSEIDEKVANVEVDLTGYATEDYVDSRFVRATITLAADGWENNCQTIAIASVTADPSLTDVTVSPDTSDENYTAYTESGIRLYTQNDGSVTFKCNDVPSVNLIVNIIVNRTVSLPNAEEASF